MKLPIRVRLAVWYAALLAVTIVGLSVFLVVQLRADLLDALDEEVRIGSVEIAKSLVDDADPGQHPGDAAEDRRDFQEAARSLLSPNAAGAQLLDARGRTLMRYGLLGGKPLASQRVRVAAGGGIPQTFTRSVADQRYRVRVSSLRQPDQVQVRVLVIAESLQPVEDAVRRVVALLLVAGPAAVVVTGLTAYWLAYRAVQPVERITTEAREIGIDRLRERLAIPRSHDETRRLAVTLNEMLARIEQGVLEKHRLLADASHELRTPLAIMRSEIDVALVADDLAEPAREVLASTRDEVDRMTRTVDNLLTSAQADEGRLELLTSPVDLRRLVNDAVRALHPLAEAKRVRLEAGGQPWEVQADAARLQLVLTNLLDNAIKFSPADATVRINTWRREHEVGVTITDQGPGIADHDAEHLFDRFYRVDNPLTANLGGSGLGLAICQDVVLAHGGRIWVERAPTGGSAFSLTLPPWRSLKAPAASV